ncbi:hypothetical protein ABT013_14535 [Streptomyces bacillaris]|uniref:hypothetical protein n=2 Tax=Streptomyces TaxID=1883 RepID=UPI00037E235D|nr:MULTISPECIES: hypothetical protein [Streptomyces]MYR36098.1 hypothetical protein [Streptomyces sp. SID4944]ALC25986.1 hypothetical protein ABE83_01975 [Streptomyces sp. CFMR 7]MBT3074827.1 hypothetical protein [Streptomyces sp. COG21]MBT3081880.1 hypothetical protein [Streptomyces sp. COG20]MBT3085087.1 hypothetical protein [Streptomyces sp. CYG21]
MRIIDHTSDVPDKILHIKSVGCDVNIIVGTHDPNGVPFTTIEVLPHEPDDDGVNWLNIGTSSVLVVPFDHTGRGDGKDDSAAQRN